ncbi:MAG: Uma2 family endonuclease [Gemmataceae bacterium]
MSAPPAPLPPAAAPALLTADEFAARYAHVHAELVKGVVKECPMTGFKVGTICVTIGVLIYNHVKAHDLGHVASNDTWVHTGSNPDTVRGADVLFISYERLPKGDVGDSYLTVAPDLVVEVKSPSDRWNDLFVKVGEYLGAGVRVVVLVDPATESVSVYRMEDGQRTLGINDTLTLPDVLPGFSMPVAHLFA